MYRYFLIFAICLALSGTSLFLYFLSVSPQIGDLENCFTPSISEQEVCPNSSEYIKLEQIPEVLKNAVLIAEDAGFYYHIGFDLYELQQSILRNIKSNKYVRGASTISQQLVKNIYLSKDKTLQRKLIEAFLTLRLESKYSKDKILELYFNTVQFAPNAFGVRTSSLVVFQKHVSELNIAESIALAQSLPNPQIYLQKKDGSFLEKITKRCLVILDKLYAFKRIDMSQYEEAKLLFNLPPWHQYQQSVDGEDESSTNLEEENQ